jgi:hypothetical protein
MRAVVVAALALVAVSYGVLADDLRLSDSEADLGTWRISRVIWRSPYTHARDGTPLDPMTPREAKRLIGKTVVLSKSGGLIDPELGKPCYPHRVASIVDRDGLLDLYRAGTMKDLGLPNSVVVFSYGCLEFFLRTDGNLVVGMDGTFFELQRVQRKSASLKR